MKKIILTIALFGALAFNHYNVVNADNFKEKEKIEIEIEIENQHNEFMNLFFNLFNDFFEDIDEELEIDEFLHQIEREYLL